MQILLTGASGFVGAHMLKFLMENTDAHVYCPVTYSHGGHPQRIESLISEQYFSRISLFQHDLANVQLDNSYFPKNIDQVINFASESHVDRSIVDPHTFVMNNVQLMINLLEFSRKFEIASFLHVSTDEVFGDFKDATLNTEWSQPHLPSNPYSASKSAQESLAISYWRTYGVNISIANSTNIIGEAQNIEKFLPKVIGRILSGDIINIDTDIDGNMGSRRYVYARDMVSAIWLIINNATNKKSNTGRDLPVRFHISGSAEISNQMLVNLVGQALKVEPKIQLGVSPRFGYDLRYELDSSKIRALGWEEKLKIEHSIEAICKWTLANQEWLSHDYSN
jgi:dTDP-glucose 4,6-dehydratase